MYAWRQAAHVKSRCDSQFTARPCLQDTMLIVVIQPILIVLQLAAGGIGFTRYGEDITIYSSPLNSLTGPDVIEMHTGTQGCHVYIQTQAGPIGRGAADGTARIIVNPILVGNLCL